ncbi:hypothetical protein MAR_030274, partial [Mya arenaria]
MFRGFGCKEKSNDSENSDYDYVGDDEVFLWVSDNNMYKEIETGGVSDEFTRKLQAWEELKGKRSSTLFK